MTEVNLYSTKERIAAAFDKAGIDFEGDKIKALEEVEGWVKSNARNSKVTSNIKNFESVKGCADGIDFSLAHAGKEKKRKLYIRKDGKIKASVNIE